MASCAQAGINADTCNHDWANIKYITVLQELTQLLRWRTWEFSIYQHFSFFFFIGFFFLMFLFHLSLQKYNAKIWLCLSKYNAILTRGPRALTIIWLPGNSRIGNVTTHCQDHISVIPGKFQPNRNGRTWEWIQNIFSRGRVWPPSWILDGH